MRALTGVLVVVIAGLPASHGRTPAPEPDTAHVVRERVRLQAHFDTVLAELSARDVSQLNPARRQARTVLLAWLQQYRNAGEFPRNDRFAEATPFFRDAGGTLCAMAYLVSRSGRADVVDRIAHTENNAYIRQMRDPALATWLDSVGFTLDEAARVQPAYAKPGDVDGGRFLAAALMGGTAVVASGLNIVTPSPSTGWLGFLSGIGSVAAFGIPDITSTGERKDVARNMLIIGATSMALSIRGFRQGRASGPARAEAPPRRRPELRAGPVLVPGAGSTALGIALNARF